MEKKDRVQKKLMMWKAQEVSMNMWHKTGSDTSRKVIPASKTNLNLKDLVVEDKALLKMDDQQSSTHTLSAELVLHKALSINASIVNRLLKYEMAQNIAKLLTSLYAVVISRLD